VANLKSNARFDSLWLGSSILPIAMCVGLAANAHPHVFVDAHTGFILDEDRMLTALRISWTYDEFTTLVLFETLNLDKDRDGVFDETDRAAVVAGETNWDPEYKGDVYLEVAGNDYALGRPKAASASMENQKISVTYSLPLPKPVKVEDIPVVLRLYDPSYYYSYSILPPSLVDDLPQGCVGQILPFKPNAANRALQEQLAQLSREEEPSQSDVGRLFSDEVSLICR